MITWNTIGKRCIHSETNYGKLAPTLVSELSCLEQSLASSLCCNTSVIRYIVKTENAPRFGIVNKPPLTVKIKIFYFRGMIKIISFAEYISRRQLASDTSLFHFK